MARTSLIPRLVPFGLWVAQSSGKPLPSSQMRTRTLPSPPSRMLTSMCPPPAENRNEVRKDRRLKTNLSPERRVVIDRRECKGRTLTWQPYVGCSALTRW